MADALKDVWFGLGANKSERCILVIAIGGSKDQVTKNALDRKQEFGCDEITIIRMETAEQFAADLRAWLFEALDVVGTEATEIIRSFGQASEEVLCR